MPKKSLTVGAIIGSTLMALSLVGSNGNTASILKPFDKTSLAEVARLHALGKVAFLEGRYYDARAAFWAAAAGAMRAGSSRDAAMNWGNAGFASVAAMRYGPALEDLSLARDTAQASGEMVPLIYALNDLASLYLQMGDPKNALRISRDALRGPASHADARMRARLLSEEALALAALQRLPEAEPIFRQALMQMMDVEDLEGAARGWTSFGGYCLDAGEYEKAETALGEALRLVRTHRLRAAANVLTNLGKLRGKQGRVSEAEYLFQDALDAHETVTPLWVIYYERGLFRLETGNSRSALEDFRVSRRLAIRMRADIVPADQNRVTVENYVNRILEGLVDAGNRIAVSTGGRGVVTETFNAAEQDRLWSLRALVPEANDWRSRLPESYWELLVRFQSAERSLLARSSVEMQKKSAELELQLEQAEATAGSGKAATLSPTDDAPSEHVKKILDSDSVLFSFSITKTASWLWAVDRQHIAVYPLPSSRQITQEAANFTQALQEGRDSTAAGRTLYRSLFAGVPAATLAHRRWLLEPDGPLYDLPFAALPVERESGENARPQFLIERAILQTIPGALLIERGGLAPGAFLGVGDAIFNTADSRYRGSEPQAAARAAMLPRLSNTAAEIDACSRAWGTESPLLLTGTAARIDRVESALSASPAVIHFATHVLTSPGQFGSGLIALGLNEHGVVGLLGPRDIAARPLPGSLIVMNGCHSAQGETLPGSGLMGLTRAWIGAGARAVLSTRWDVPDDAAQSFMVTFYRALRNSPLSNPAMALREAQLTALHSGSPENQPRRWAGYLLLSRIQ